ncbi:MAG: VIT domain-containing protein [Bacteroidota bacterium]
MKKTAFLRIFFLSLIISCAQVKNSQQFRAVPTSMPVLNIVNDTTAAALTIQSLAVDIQVAANIATTTFDIIFYNPNDRVLEGEFEFPLADGQHIVRYALDMEGQLREGVVVEKAKARVAFESTIRRKIDPGLVEKTKGNNFRTRIYPLPAKGTRHIMIAVEQTLELLNKDLYYQLPLASSHVIEKFSVAASVIKSTEKPVPAGNSLAGFEFGRKENGWVAAYSAANFMSDEAVAFTIPGPSDNETAILAENYNGLTYFYVNSRMGPAYKEKKLPGTIGIFWDVSASGEKRNIEKEKLLLKEYLSGDVQVSLITFNVYLQGKEDFAITNGNCGALLKRIDELQYDGGTQLGTIDLTQYRFDEVLLFSDGLASFGKKEIILSALPVTVISSSASADFSYLKFVTKQSHGKFIDLTRLEIPAALEEARNLSLQVIAVEYNPSEAEDVVVQVMPVQSSGLSFAGKLKTAAADIRVKLGFGNEVVTTKTFTIRKPDNSDCGMVKRIWAEMKIAELDLQFEKNKEDITRLGKEFSVVAQNTSLIVLDRLEDYVEHEITPPVSMQKEYFTLLSQKKELEKLDKKNTLDEAVGIMNELKEWWGRSFNPGKKPQEEILITESRINGNGTGDYRSGHVAMQFDTTFVPAPQQESNGTVSTTAVPFFRITPGIGAYSLADSSVEYRYTDISVPGDQALTFMMAEGDAKKDEELVMEKVSSIELTEWKPDAPYLKELEKAAPSARLAKYFQLRKQYSSQPSFFIDAARFFISKNEKKTGIQILSNVAELKLEDAELLRLLANQLLEAVEKELAIETFRDLLKIREEDPQPYRDLALALNEAGQYNEAVELLYKVITRSWDGRFGEIKAVAINEMNAIIAAHKNAVNTAKIDRRLIYAMPVDVRIVIGWSSDNSDIDLWVTDPRKEKCDYQHTETALGGKISQDVTSGFGPEEFMLKKAINGKYKVEVNLYGDTRQTLGGPISIKAELFTDFGKPTQKRQTINFRVTNTKEVVELGSLTFGS